MAGKQTKNGSRVVPIKKGELPHVAKLMDRDMSTESLDHLAADFCHIHEVAGRDVIHGRLAESTWNSIRGGYGNILRMLDVQMRARKMGVVPTKAKLLR